MYSITEMSNLKLLRQPNVGGEFGRQQVNLVPEKDQHIRNESILVEL